MAFKSEQYFFLEHFIRSLGYHFCARPGRTFQDPWNRNEEEGSRLEIKPVTKKNTVMHSPLKESLKKNVWQRILSKEYFRKPGCQERLHNSACIVSNIIHCKS